MSQADQIKSINVQGQNLNIVGTDGTQYTSYLGSGVSIYQVTGLNLNPPVTVTFQASGIDWLSVILTYGFINSHRRVYFHYVLSSPRRE